MNRNASLATIGMLLLAGCGPSHAERTASFVQNLRASPAVSMEVKFGEQTYRGELSKEGIEKLGDVIAAATADHHPLKYVVLGSISYEVSDTKALLLYISGREAGLRIDDNTYLRKIDLEALEAICKELDHKPDAAQD